MWKLIFINSPVNSSLVASVLWPSFLCVFLFSFESSVYLINPQNQWLHCRVSYLENVLKELTNEFSFWFKWFLELYMKSQVLLRKGASLPFLPHNYCYVIYTIIFMCMNLFGPPGHVRPPQVLISMLCCFFLRFDVYYISKEQVQICV